MRTFKAIDPRTHEVAYTHSKEAFKKPEVVDGNLHWYGYAEQTILASVGSKITEIMLGYFKEWCNSHNFLVKEPEVRRFWLTNYEMDEFEIIAPIITEGTL